MGQDYTDAKSILRDKALRNAATALMLQTSVLQHKFVIKCVIMRNAINDEQSKKTAFLYGLDLA